MDTNGDTKMLLLRDLCSRLPYGVKVNINTKKSSYTATVCEITRNYICIEGGGEMFFSHGTYKPYLRPMSSMTDEEQYICRIKRGEDLAGGVGNESDYLNSIHVDYRGLIEKGLAIAVTEENNPYKK